jgi:predicted kinase
MKRCIIMRGVPGSGKSTEAHRIAEKAIQDGQTAVVLSADDYFMVREGEGFVYRFDTNDIMKAHSWNENRIYQEMQKGTNVVVIDNTHTRPRECYTSVEMAFDHDYEVEFAESTAPWWLAAKEALKGKRNEKTLAPHVKVFASRNTHNVPEHTIYKMLNRYHLDINVDAVIRND